MLIPLLVGSLKVAHILPVVLDVMLLGVTVCFTTPSVLLFSVLSPKL